MMDEPLQNYNTDASQVETAKIRWLMLEAQRIRRERIRRRIEGGIATVCIIVWVIMLLNAVRLMIR